MNDDQKAQRSSSQGSTESDLPLENYDSLSSSEIVGKLAELSPVEVEKLCRYERANQNRKKLVKYFETRIGASIATGEREDPPPGEERPEKRRETVIGATAREDPPPGEERPEQRVL